MHTFSAYIYLLYTVHFYEVLFLAVYVRVEYMYVRAEPAVTLVGL